jgi:hypothetical protein
MFIQIFEWFGYIVWSELVPAHEQYQGVHATRLSLPFFSEPWALLRCGGLAMMNR